MELKSEFSPAFSVKMRMSGAIYPLYSVLTPIFHGT